jgi:hypothetical protein
MASTRHQHEGLVSHSLRRVRTSVDADDGYRGDSLSLDVIDEWGLSVRGLDGLARVSATR